ncbi:FIST N-terminal domain-containing protein [Polaromonas sp.]|uniref:FIST signal transduction protein n=1 Tax=Polaromonas sp. TaxID=1869339 RepID=UPI0024897DD2|nr:FIST N-terminal domain-containing protein [Polaromonas sp.]MDI1340864.1 FIST N-terminal domain-containing protein [Polaromonas sp.]
MKIEQRYWTEQLGWTTGAASLGASSQLVMVFGAPAALQKPELVAAIRKDYPAACLLGCSTAGEICGTSVFDDSLVVTAVHFEHTLLRSVEVSLGLVPDSFQAGEWIARNLPQTLSDPSTGLEEKLAHVLVLTDGLKVNGSDFVSGVMRHLPEGATMTGGLAGDGARFGKTLVFRDGVPEKDSIAALGLYGSRLKVGIGSLGGWDSFGPERLITRSEANVLYELDGRSALGLYKQYLGDHADGLPATGLLFPLSVRARPGEAPVVRTILAVDESSQSLTFAGDVPQGAYARLMKANFDRLIDGAAGAARANAESMGSVVPELAILISCVGRKLVLKQRVEEEVEAVREILGSGAMLAGFYSYGEISPFTPGATCELHNQTMTITTLSER